MHVVSSQFYHRSSDSDSHMHRTLVAAEQWMYSGGFKFNFYPNIADGITGVLSGICLSTSTPNERRKVHAVSQSFIDLLVSLAGQDVLTYIGDKLVGSFLERQVYRIDSPLCRRSQLPQNPIKRVCHVLKLYDNVLEFLAAQGAFLPHVQSEYLLSYNDHLLHCTESKSPVSIERET